MEEKSVYIHIPFCKCICSYCDFCKVYYNEKWSTKYLDALKKEITKRYMDEEIKTIYIGGGTPSSLSISELKKLFKIIKVFKTNHLKEFSFECNPSDLNPELISLLKDNGVNRISIGIESFDKNNLKFLNREASFKDLKEKISLIKDIGINNVNVDLIYAIPNEKISTLKKDLDLLCQLKIEHISTYSLMIEPNTMLSYHNTKPINEELDAKMYDLIIKYLKKKGFNHYEISNFAKDGYESKHNLTYWNNEEYYGFGLGAAGYISGVRYENTKNLTKYLNGKEECTSEILSKDDMMEYEVILGLRKIKGINTKDFYHKYQMNIQSKYPKIKELIKEKELIYKNGYLFINPSKLYVMNEILVKLI